MFVRSFVLRNIWDCPVWNEALTSFCGCQCAWRETNLAKFHNQTLIFWFHSVDCLFFFFRLNERFWTNFGLYMYAWLYGILLICIAQLARCINEGYQWLCEWFRGYFPYIHIRCENELTKSGRTQAKWPRIGLIISGRFRARGRKGRNSARFFKSAWHDERRKSIHIHILVWKRLVWIEIENQ